MANGKTTFVIFTQSIEVRSAVWNELTECYPVEKIDLPVVVNTKYVREFYPRKNGKPGTRLSMSNSAGLAVNEDFATVYKAVTGTTADEATIATAGALAAKLEEIKAAQAAATAASGQAALPSPEGAEAEEEDESSYH